MTETQTRISLNYDAVYSFPFSLPCPHPFPKIRIYLLPESVHLYLIESVHFLTTNLERFVLRLRTRPRQEELWRYILLPNIASLVGILSCICSAFCARNISSPPLWVRGSRRDYRTHLTCNGSGRGRECARLLTASCAQAAQPWFPKSHFLAPREESPRQGQRKRCRQYGEVLKSDSPVITIS